MKVCRWIFAPSTGHPIFVSGKYFNNKDPFFFKIFPKQTVTHPFLPNSYTQQVTQYHKDLLFFTDPIHSKVKIFDPPKLHKFQVYLPGLLCLNKTYRTNLIWIKFDICVIHVGCISVLSYQYDVYILHI